MRKLLAPLALCLSLQSQSQDLIDIGGDWDGNSTFMNSQFHVTFSFEQSGSQLEGISTTVSMDQKDSAVVAFTGVIEGNEVEIFATEFVYKQGNACLSNSVLTFTPGEDQNSLIGKWKGDMRLSSCPPLVGGDIKLYKRTPKPRPRMETTASTDPLAVLDEDYIASSLMLELENTYHALLIGVEDYKHSSVPRLQYPVGDAEDLAQVLEAHYAFESEDITILRNPTRNELIESLDRLRKKVTEKDNLLIFYAGHGVWEEELNQGYWLPSNASMNTKSNWISNSTVRDYVRGIKTKHTLLIADACFSGGILRERSAFENSRAMLELYKMPSRKALTSGTLKTVPDKSVFMQYLLKNLLDNDQPLLSTDELFRKFKIAVINNSPNAQVPQYGPIWQAGDEGGEFIFLKKARE